MRKALLIVAMLLSVAPVMAATTITAVQEGAQFTLDGTKQQTVRIDYTSDVDVRAFALDINIDAGPTFDSIRGFKTGESNAASPGYGIFPSRFRDFIVVTGPNWVDTNYNPTTAWNEPGSTNTGMGWPKMIVELGTLYAGDPNKPALSGTLFRFDVNSEQSAGTYNVTIAGNALRGGVVGSDGNAIAAPTFVGTAITFVNRQCVVPNLIGMNRVAAIAAINAADCNCGVEANVPPTAAGQLRTIIAQSQVAGTILPFSSLIDINAVSYPIKQMTVANSLYVNWIARSRPQCWAYARQCHGDADGKKLGTWVGAPDLTILKGAITKADAAIPAGGMCADFDHKKLGTWIGSPDLTILKTYITKADALVPMCGNITTVPSTDPNYWYWCIPTGGAACPAGQKCAPIGVCPNEP